ncbi:MAG: hypothetical protein JNL12_22630 [Planctomycetes bacterium]|nr:hypothetical protein [Planctomycetota bacterium]
MELVDRYGGHVVAMPALRIPSSLRLGLLCLLVLTIPSCSGGWSDAGTILGNGKQWRVEVWDGGATTGGRTYLARIVELKDGEYSLQGWIEDYERRDVSLLPIRRSPGGDLTEFLIRSAEHEVPAWHAVTPRK